MEPKLFETWRRSRNNLVFLGMKYTDRLTVTTADLLAELDHNDVRLDGLYDEADIVAALPGEVSRAHQVHSGSAHL